MILIFGGTTEGKKAAKILDFINEPYFYSTKTANRLELKGKAIHGAMDHDAISEFCRKNAIRLLVDAAHPFAVQLHRNIDSAAREFKIPVLRYEREYPEMTAQKNIRFFNSFEQLSEAILQSKLQKIVALTGVQTIPVLKKVWKKRQCYFRILNTTQSKTKAQESGIPGEYIIPMSPSDNAAELLSLAQTTKAELLLSKESGISGYITAKTEVARQLNISLWIVKRPVLPHFDFTINTEKQFLKKIYSLRKTILKDKKKLRSGYTTGTCVTAAVKACFIALHEGTFPETAEVFLPDGAQTNFLIFPESLTPQSATCTVIKNAGDDPDVTHGKEICCELIRSKQRGIRFRKGKGIGKVTLPGLQLAVGEPAINPVPRKMITEALETLTEEYETDFGFEVIPFIPEGEKLARQTFNSRVGVVGGLSIIGTTGRVKPYSNEAFVSTIKSQLSVAYESGHNEVVFTSGKRSENRLKTAFTHLPDTAFIHFGNLVGASINMAVQQKIKKINLGIMFGKASKLAEGHLNTHSKNVRFNADFLTKVADECAYPAPILSQIKKLKIANAIFPILPVKSNRIFYQTIARKCFNTCRALIPPAYSFSFILLLEEEENICVE